MAQTVRCSNCGASGTTDEKFCGECGSPRTGSEAAVEPQSSSATGATDVDIFSEMAPSRPASIATVEPPRAPASDSVVDVAPPNGSNDVPRGPIRQHLVGEATPNSTYLGQRLLYTPPEAFNPMANGRWLAQVSMHAFLFWLLWAVVGFVFWVFFLFAAFVTKTPGVFVLYFLGAGVTGLALAVIWFFKPFPALLSEWKFAVDEKGAAETTAFEHITWAFRRRETPVQSLRVRRLSLSGSVSRDYLEVRSGLFYGYVSCFAYGNDLYIGWTYWLVMSPFRWVILWCKGLWLALTMRGSDLFVTLRYDPARAMREAVHAACREGVDVAAGEVAPEGEGIVGTEVGIDLTNLTSID